MKPVIVWSLVPMMTSGDITAEIILGNHSYMHFTFSVISIITATVMCDISKCSWWKDEFEYVIKSIPNNYWHTTICTCLNHIITL